MSAYKIVTYCASELPREYANLVISRWKRSLRHGSVFFREIDQEAFYDTYNLLIIRILARPDTKVRFAVLADDEDVILGFAVIRKNILDYVHVNREMRRLGIATRLVGNEIDTVTHLTSVGWAIRRRKYRKIWKFNPFA